MPIFRYAKVLLLAPSVGSALIAVVGLMLSVALIFALRLPDRRFASAPHAAPAAFVPKDTPAAPHTDEAQLLNGNNNLLPRISVPKTITAQAKSTSTHFNNAVFQKPIARNQLGFLTEYVGRPANDIVREPKLRNLMNVAVPFTPFHYGLDMPLPYAMETALTGSLLPVQIRDARYVMVSSRGGRNGSARGGFIWIDMREGIVLGGIYFHPSNGEPTPTLTIFSSQVDKDSLGMNQLPAAFVHDLGQWAATIGVPPVTTRYFINASNEKIVLTHDEDFCSRAASVAVSPDGACEELKARAVDIDLRAARFLEQAHYASNATMRMLAETSPVE